MQNHYEFEIDTDHYQFYFEDEHFQWPDLTDPVYQQRMEWAHSYMLNVLSGRIEILTMQEKSSHLTVEILTANPNEDDFDGWDHIVEASIITRNSLYLGNPRDGDVGKVDLLPNSYRVRVYYGDLDTNEEHFKVMLWPDAEIEPIVLKKWDQL